MPTEYNQFSLARLETETPQLDCGDNWMCRCYRSSLAAVQLRRGKLSSRGFPRYRMNVALPEVDGRIISRAVSFKAVQTRNPDMETDVIL